MRVKSIWTGMFRDETCKFIVSLRSRCPEGDLHPIVATGSCVGLEEFDGSRSWRALNVRSRRWTGGRWSFSRTGVMRCVDGAVERMCVAEVWTICGSVREFCGRPWRWAYSNQGGMWQECVNLDVLWGESDGGRRLILWRWKYPDRVMSLIWAAEELVLSRMTPRPEGRDRLRCYKFIVDNVDVVPTKKNSVEFERIKPGFDVEMDRSRGGVEVRVDCGVWTWRKRCSLARPIFCSDL